MDLRPSPIAGRWYPAQAASLAAAVDRWLVVSPEAPPGAAVTALVVPHAGHLYSGAVAGQAFATVQGQAYAWVVVVCPSHFHDDGALLTSGHAGYLTPLGPVPVDQAGVQLLRQALGPLGLVPLRRDREHAIEIELPFLQRALAGEFALLPIMMRDQSADVARALGQALARVARASGRRVLVVGSSDLAHFYTQAETEPLDAAMLRQVAAFDPDGVEAVQASGQGQACGYGAIAATLWAARELGANQARVLAHATSGEVSGDYESVVGYGAAVFWQATAGVAP